MKIVHEDEISYQRFSEHRAGMMQHKQLLHGNKTAPDNFELSLVLSGDDYATPPHRHNFDQIRYMLQGSFNYGPKRKQTEGSLSYFPEGSSYTQQADGESLTLLLQFGGASGQGFMSYDDLGRGYQELAQKGVFEGGVFSWQDENGKRHNQDGYEAIWSHIMGRKINYPKPRYDQPVLMQPENYAWIKAADEEGVETRTCGRFTERDIGTGFIHIQAGAGHKVRRRRIYFILSGSGAVQDLPWSRHTAIYPEGDEALTMLAESDSELVFFDLPDFSMESG